MLVTSRKLPISPQAVPIGHKHHRRVAPAIAIGLGRFQYSLDLGLGTLLRRIRARAAALTYPKYFAADASTGVRLFLKSSIAPHKNAHSDDRSIVQRSRRRRV